MPHHRSPEKQVRRDAKRKILNHSRRHRMATFVKKVERAITDKSPQAQEAFRIAQSELLRGARKGLIHINTASRKISKLSTRLAI